MSHELKEEVHRHLQRLTPFLERIGRQTRSAVAFCIAVAILVGQEVRYVAKNIAHSIRGQKLSAGIAGAATKTMPKARKVIRRVGIALLVLWIGVVVAVIIGSMFAASLIEK